MIIHRDRVVRLLRKRDYASRAAVELPEKIDTELHRSELTRFGLNPVDVMKAAIKDEPAKQ